MLSALSVSGCKGRPTDGQALADATQTARAQWNGRDCFFGSSMSSIKRLNYLDLGFRYELSEAEGFEWQSRPAWLQPVIVEGMKQIWGQNFATAAAAINAADDRTIWYTRINNFLDPQLYSVPPVDAGTADVTPAFYLFEALSGDTWVGFVAQVDRPVNGGWRSNNARYKIVNKYGDGDTYDCALKRPTPAQRRGAEMPTRLCAFGDNTGYLGSSLSRSNGVWRENGEARSLTATSTLTDIQRKEIVEGMEEFISEDRSPAALIRATDDDEIIYREITYRHTGRTYRWYRFYSGDTQVGFIYGPDESGTIRQVASVGDGSIGSCFVKKARAR